MPNNTVVAPTTWVTSVFSAFASFNWAEIARSIEQRSLGGAITTAEHVAEAVAGAFATTGNPIAIGVSAALPAAESIIGAVLNMIPALHASGAATTPGAPSPDKVLS